MSNWFRTANLFNKTHSLLPSAHNASEIPFLQLANDRMHVFGCAYVICDSGDKPEGDIEDDDYFDWFVSRNVSLTCTYGQP
ncbi:unnamed protein product [Angiostrongylus costaricensis]|uniref:DSPn domain-containing protein n=1 Tax=Angiostrongylus costaricensis TaxID=334426 RepID=A0A0R3PXR4_ANGCS|nr:unnamed protein product [Angiostrongylus costaricensis]